MDLVSTTAGLSVAWLFRYNGLVWLVGRVIRDSSGIRWNGGGGGVGWGRVVRDTA